MSLILEALKKAEQERNAGQAPAVQQVLTRPMPAARQRQQREQRHLLLIVAACVVITLLALAFAFWPRHPLVVKATQPATSPPSTPAATAPADASPVVTTQATPPPTLRVDPERLHPFEAQTGNGNTDGNEAAEASTLDDLAEDRPPSPKPTPIAAPRRTAESQGVIVPSPPDEPDTASAAPAVTDQPATAAVPSTATVRPLQDMPVSFRAELPKLTVDVHVYDANPLKRFAIVNGKKYREGDTLVEGPRVAAITADGVVIEHKGSQVLLPLPH